MPPRNKQTSESKASKSDRAVLHPEIKIETYLGDNALTVAKAKELLGWEDQDVTESVPDGLTTLTGKKVHCKNNQHNRPYTDSWSAQLSQDILNRNWADSRNGEGMSVNGETVIVSTTGQILSAQHRLIGLIKAGEQWAGPQNDHWLKKWDTEPTMEAIVVYGISDHPHVTRTLDNVRPRDLGDVFITDTTLFAKSSSTERKQLAHMLGSSIKMIWSRTGLKNDPFNPYLSNSEACDFVERHPKLKAAVKHVSDEYKADWKKNNGRLASGTAAALLYLMATSDSDPDKYAKKGYKESALDFTNWEKACEFWTLICGDSPVMKGVRETLSSLYNEDGEGTPSNNEKVAVFIKAWNEFKIDGPLTLKRLTLNYSAPDEDGIKHLLESPKVGGIDIGDRKAEDEDKAPAPVSKKEQAANEEECKAQDRREEIARLQEENPGMVILIKGSKTVSAWAGDAEVVAQALNLLTDSKDGLLHIAFPVKNLKENIGLLLKADIRVGLAENNDGVVTVTEQK